MNKCSYIRYKKELNNKKLINEKEIITNNKMDANSQSTGLKRRTIDKYYTSQDAVNKCIDLIRKTIEVNEDDLCIEPSAGNGSFINGIKSLFKNYRFYDLEPEKNEKNEKNEMNEKNEKNEKNEMNEIIKQDYLEFNYNTMIKTDFNKKHIVGNPPFGRQSSLAIKFIKKSAEYCDSISFILPKSFKKESLKKHFPLNLHLVCESQLSDNSFIVDNKSYDVPCVFQIWVKKDTNRTIPKKLIPNKFSFVKKEIPHDISFRRVGINAGEIHRETENKSIQSHYFIKFDDILTNEKYMELSIIVYHCKDNTVGPKSISKPELIKEFNMVL